MLLYANHVSSRKQLPSADKGLRHRTSSALWRRRAARPVSHLRAVQDDTEPASLKQQSGAAPDLTDMPAVAAKLQQEVVYPAKQIPYGLVAAISTAGAIETGYLLLTKLTNTTPVCPTSGCESVLTSGYAELFGIPLPLLGALTYGAVGALAANGLFQQREPGFAGTTTGIDTAITAGAAALAATSATLMYVLFTKLGGQQCIWCLGSAGLSAAILAAVLSGLSPQKLREATVPGLSTASMTMGVLLLAWRQVVYIPDDFYLPYTPPPVSAQSTPQSIDLARRLSAAGAKMYGAFWCTHCLEQKDVFGQQAMAEFPYEECYPTGWKKGQKITPVCEAAGIKAFPSWKFGDKLVEGEQEFDQLEAELAQLTAKQAAPALSGQ